MERRGASEGHEPHHALAGDIATPEPTFGAPGAAGGQLAGAVPSTLVISRRTRGSSRISWPAPLSSTRSA